MHGINVTTSQAKGTVWMSPSNGSNDRNLPSLPFSANVPYLAYTILAPSPPPPPFAQKNLVGDFIRDILPNHPPT